LLNSGEESSIVSKQDRSIRVFTENLHTVMRFLLSTAALRALRLFLPPPPPPPPPRLPLRPPRLREAMAG